MSGFPNAAAETTNVGAPDRTGSKADAKTETTAGSIDFAAALARMLAGGTPAGSEAPASAGPSHPMQKETGLDELAPEFRTRLERVIARMEALGHTVEVVETYRDQSRQDFLYEQGRSRSGPVVTWTRESNHTQRRAVDLRIDGTYESPAAYRTLAIIAEQEGLRTLGPRDAGHVELPHMGNDTASSGTLPSARAAGPAPTAAVASVATVAPIAQVATVAQVASVAPVVNFGDVGLAAVVERSAGREGQEDSDQGTAQPTPADVFANPGQDYTAANSAASPSVAELRAHGTSPLDRTADANIAARVARVLDLQDATHRQPLSSVVLRLDGAELSSLIRVARRGNEISTSIDVADPLRAQELRGHLGELRSAIEAHGLRPELTVQAVSPADPMDLTVGRLPLPDAGIAALADAANTKDAQMPSSGQRPHQEQNQPGGGQRQRPRREHDKQEER